MSRMFFSLAIACIILASPYRAAAQEMTPFLSAEVLRQNLISKDMTKMLSAVSYVGGIADYLLFNDQICPPPGATAVKAALLVKKDLKRDPNEYPHLPAVVPTEFALKIAWPCK